MNQMTAHHAHDVDKVWATSQELVRFLSLEKIGYRFTRSGIAKRFNLPYQSLAPAIAECVNGKFLQKTAAQSRNPETGRVCAVYEIVRSLKEFPPKAPRSRPNPFKKGVNRLLSSEQEPIDLSSPEMQEILALTDEMAQEIAAAPVTPAETLAQAIRSSLATDAEALERMTDVIDAVITAKAERFAQPRGRLLAEADMSECLARMAELHAAMP